VGGGNQSGRLSGPAGPRSSAQRRPQPRLLEWLAEHPTGSLADAAQALDLTVADLETFWADLVDAGMIERAVQ
jgi:hypothetical protein